MAETAKKPAKKAAAKKTAAPKPKDESVDRTRASDKKADDRTFDEIKVAGEVAAAKVKQEQYDAIKAAQEKNQEQANKNDSDDYGKAAAFTEDFIKAKLEESTTPLAVAKEKENYVADQALYQQQGLTATAVNASK